MGVRVRQKDGAWWLFINHQGKRKAKRVGVGDPAKEAAKKAAARIQAKLVLGDLSPIQPKENPLTLKEYAERWLTVHARVHDKASTVENYEGYFRVHIYPTLGNLPLPSMTRAHVKEWVAERLRGGNSRSEGKPLAASTVKSILIPLRAMLMSAVDDGLIPSNPAAHVGKFLNHREGTPTKKVDPFTSEELNHVLLKTCQTHYPESYPFVLTLARSGVRIGEASALALEDFEMARGFMRVRRSFSEGRLSTPKTGDGRCVDMSQQLQTVLTDYLGARMIEATVRGKTASPWVFGTLDRVPLDSHEWRRKVWDPLLKVAGLRHRGPHQLRHTYASLLLMAGKSPAYVSKQLGHKSIKITVDLYGHFIPGANRQEVDVLDDPETVLPATKRNPGETEKATRENLIPVSACQH
jgi:integrase